MRLLITLILSVFSMVCTTPVLYAEDFTIEPDGEFLGHGYVDLGLPSGTLWAVTNIGAETPYDCGSYFSWGELEPKEEYTNRNYEYYVCDYWTPRTQVYEFSMSLENICDTEYDTAKHQWGDGWRMPSYNDFLELWNNCGERDIVIDDVHYWLYSNNGKSMLMPYAGGYTELGLAYFGQDFCNWLGELAVVFPELPLENQREAINFGSSYYWDKSSRGSGLRYCGLTIRAVTDPQTIARVSGISIISDALNKVEISYTAGYVKIQGEEGVYQLKINDLTGRTVMNEPVNTGCTPVNTLSKGVYVFSLYKGTTLLKTEKIAVR